MITPDSALESIFERALPLSAETVALADCVGRILSEDVIAREDLPPFDNSAMDGYAVRCEDLKSASRDEPVSLTVREVVRAGSLAREEVGPGEAMRIMTGAPLPRRADAVVMKELTVPDGSDRTTIAHSPRPGDQIRVKGEDIRRGTPILKKGTFIRPYEVALLAAQGITGVPVIRKPDVAVLATGDELVPVTEPLGPGKIRNSNGPAISSALARWGLRATDLGTVRDDPGELEAKMKEALSRADVVLVSGGVSVGEFDYTKQILERLGVSEVFWKVAMKPGKPLFFGEHSVNGKKKLVFGLPGNPVSVMVCLEEFVRPALERLQGNLPKHPSYHLQGKVVNDYPKPVDRQQYIFCQATRKGEEFEIRIIRPQGSAMMGMATQANALAVSPIGVNRVRQGDVLPFRWLK